jgi:hypothetical protein
MREDGGRSTGVLRGVMIVHGESRTGALLAVTAHMASEFGGAVPPALVAAVVRDAERDLRGQVVPGSLGEMLHRLAAVRLQELMRDLDSLDGDRDAARSATSTLV